MVKQHPLYALLFVSAIVYAVTSAWPDSNSFREQLIQYIDRHSEKEKTVTSDEVGPAGNGTYIPLIPWNPSYSSSTTYEKGDWSSIILAPRYGFLMDNKKGQALYRGEDMAFISYGSLNLNLSYGRSMYTSSKYRLSDSATATSRVISPGFLPEQEMQLHMEGQLGDRMTVYIDHDSKSDNNHYYMQYRALNENETIRELNAGEIDIKFNNSKYAVFDNTTSKGLGVDMTLRKNNLQVKAFGSVTRGQSVTETFRGKSSSNTATVPEYNYIARTYYQLEPYIRYDGSGSTPSFPAAYTSFNTFTSADPEFTPASVNISPSGFAIYMDDQNTGNDYNATELSIDGGYYTRLSNGTDYSINYTTGLITFLRSIPRKARIFVLYNLSSGSSTDPAVNTTIYSGQNFVFIKYGYSMDEDADRDGVQDSDTNGDGRMNLDVYEVRSRFSLGKQDILSRDFSIKFYNGSETLNTSQKEMLGDYTIDYSDGIVYFNLREPFKQLLSGDSQGIIYTEKQADSVADSSAYHFVADYYSESRSFQLKHANVIQGSERIRINSRIIDSSLYSIEYTSGYLTFRDADNPSISSDTEIEVTYQYLPLGGQSQDFVGGVRADYTFNKKISVGGSALISRSSAGETIPLVNSEPVQTVLIEGDTSLNLDGRSLARIYNFFSREKKQSLPLEIKGYAEYAKSYRNVNTFGKGLVENMESSDDAMSLSMSEKNWILSSMMSTSSQSDRGLLYYYYYRDPDDPGSLKGLSYNARGVDYSMKPGPFNVATGHIDSSIEESSSQTSLVFDYDFSSGTQVSVATRKLSDDSVDLSGLQYIEVFYRLSGESSSDSVNLYLDVGSLNEDSDGDGTLDTEDDNSDSVLQSDEDTGYAFNGNTATIVGSGPGLSTATSGDGILNTEDLDGNGTLDTTENSLQFPGSSTSPASLTLTASSSWQKSRIYVDLSSLSRSELNILKETESVRLTLEQNSGTKGRLFIDKIRFVYSKWKNIQMDGSGTTSDHLEVTYLNSMNDADYRSEAFLFKKESLYQSLYGSLTDDELASSSESTLQLEYNVSGGQNVSVERGFSDTLDIRFYKTLNIWYNCRSFQSGDTLRVRIGSSDDDYREYEVPMSNTGLWQQAKLKLRSGSDGDYEITATSGDPDMKRVSFIRLYMDAPDNTGKIWINDIYASEPLTLESSAYWYEGEIKTNSPVFRTRAGTPVLSDISLKYVQKGHGAQFSSVGQTVSDMSENYQQFFSSVNILPTLRSSFDYTCQATETDSLNEEVDEDLRGKTTKNTFNFATVYSSRTNAVPSISISSKSELYENEIDEDYSGESVRSRTNSYKHAPVLLVNEKVDGFLFGSLTSRLKVDLLFKNEDIDRESETLDQSSLASLVSTAESEKVQSNRASFEMNYRNGLFFLKPAVAFSTEELVQYRGKIDSGDSRVLTDFAGDFHLPFCYDNSIRFVERDSETSVSFGINELGLITPRYMLELDYSEDSFRDYTESELSQSGDFSRCRDARSVITTRIDIPVNLKKLGQPGKPPVIKGLNTSFSRSLYLSEDSVPYEGEGTGNLDERYGITRSISGLSGAGLNIFQYYPGFFFTGRDSAARGRDYIYRTFNKSISATDTEFSDYDNTLKIIENYALNMFLDFQKFTLDTGAGLNQVCERSNTSGVPSQIITGTVSASFNFNLMELFSFWFFRPNKSGLPHHSSTLSLGYSIINNNVITSNRIENEHVPSFGINFKWDRSYFGVNMGVNIRHEKWHEFIAEDDSRSSQDDIYYENMDTDSGFSELDTGYNFGIVYETDVQWLYELFSVYYTLVASPIFRTEYTMKINRYDYSLTTSPEPYDLYMLSASLSMDLHKNVRGSLGGRVALENYYDVGTSHISSRVFSAEASFKFTLLF